MLFVDTNIIMVTDVIIVLIIISIINIIVVHIWCETPTIFVVSRNMQLNT